MIHRSVRAVTLAVVCAALAAGPWPCGAETASEEGRIVSLVPSFTETLFALGAGHRVAGVSNYCNYPPEAARLPRAGGLFDPTLEVIAALSPSLVVVSGYAAGTEERLAALGIASLSLRHDTLEEILASFRALGEACGRAAEGEALAASLEADIARAREASAERPRVRTLLVVGRDVSEPRLRTIYAAGHSGYLNELLEAAGGENALPEGRSAYPVLSAESVIAINPELVLEITDARHQGLIDSGEALKAWAAVPGLKLAEEGRVRILSGGHLNIPGPRIGATLRDFARALHPETGRE